MSEDQTLFAAYAVITLLLWGYAVRIWLAGKGAK